MLVRGGGGLRSSERRPAELDCDHRLEQRTAGEHGQQRECRRCRGERKEPPRAADGLCEAPHPATAALPPAASRAGHRYYSALSRSAHGVCPVARGIYVGAARINAELRGAGVTWPQGCILGFATLEPAVRHNTEEEPSWAVTIFR